MPTLLPFESLCSAADALIKGVVRVRHLVIGLSRHVFQNELDRIHFHLVGDVPSSTGCRRSLEETREPDNFRKPPGWYTRDKQCSPRWGTDRVRLQRYLPNSCGTAPCRYRRVTEAPGARRRY